MTGYAGFLHKKSQAGGDHGSEVYGAVINGRRGVGVELKTSYYRQALLNLSEAAAGRPAEQTGLFGDLDEWSEDVA